MTIRTEDLRRAADPHSAVDGEPHDQAAVPRKEAIAAIKQMSGGETAIAAMAAKAQALVQARYEVAFRFPRDFDRTREKLLKECRRPSFAEVAEYNKPIGDGVQGPSIRFAEAAIRCMTNIDIDCSTVYDDDLKRIVKVCVTDLEGNVPYSMDVTVAKTVERRSKKDGDQVVRERLNSKGQKLYVIVATDDDILNKQNALISKAIRTQGLRHIPGDLIDEAMAVVHQTLSTTDAKDPDSAKRKIYDGFGQLGVGVDQIKLYLGHDGSSITPKELQTLRALYTALKEGETTWREIMDSRTPPKDQQQPKGAYYDGDARREANRAFNAQAAQPQPAKAKQDDPPLQASREEPQLSEQQQAIAAAQAESFKEHQAAQSSAAEERHHNEEAREARSATDGRQKRNEALREAEAAFAGSDSAEPAAEGRITFSEIVQAIGSAKSAKEVIDNIEPMIPEIPNARHRDTLMRMANNKKESLQEQVADRAAAQPQTPRQSAGQSAASSGPPAGAAARTRRNVDMD